MDQVPECPVCAHWVCTRCGYKRMNANRMHPQMDCPKCGSIEGEYTKSIRHRDRRTHEEHVALHTKVTPLHAPFPTYDRMINAMILVRQLDDPWLRFSAAVLDAQMFGSEEPGFSEARSRGNAALLEIESIVRTWVAERPPTGTEGIR